MSTQTLYYLIPGSLVFFSWGFLALDVALGMREQRRLRRAEARALKSFDVHTEQAIRMIRENH